MIVEPWLEKLSAKRNDIELYAAIFCVDGYVAALSCSS